MRARIWCGVAPSIRIVNVLIFATIQTIVNMDVTLGLAGVSVVCCAIFVDFIADVVVLLYLCGVLWDELRELGDRFFSDSAGIL